MSEEDPTFFNDKNFDIYTHMKCNIKCTIKICEIHDSILSYYCFYCKRSICEVCKESFHSEHNYLPKQAIGLKAKHLPLMFNRLETAIKETEAFSNPDKLVKDIKEHISSEFEFMQNKLQELKERRIKEVYKTFNNSNEDALKLIKNITSTKEHLLTFFKKHSVFLENDGVNDDDNFIFLQIYDLFNSTVNKSNEYFEIIKKLKDYYEDNDLRQRNKFSYILKSIDKGLEEQKHNELKSENIIQLNNDDELNSSKRKNFSDQVDDIFKVQEEKHNSNDNIDQKEVLRTFIMNNKHVLKLNNYEFLEDKLQRLDDYIENFKKSVFDSFAKHGSLVEVEKLVRLYEEKTVKRMNYLQQSQSVFSSKTKASIRGSKAGLTRSKINLQTMNKDKDKDKEKENTLNVNKANSEEPKNRKFSLNNAGSSNKHSELSPQKKRASALPSEMFSLEENDDEDEEDPQYLKKKKKLVMSKLDEKDSDFNHSSDESLFGNSEDTKIDVRLEKNNKDNNKTMKKLNNMFRPKPKLNFSKNRQDLTKEHKDMPQSEDEKFKVNAKLLELIRENQRLTSMIKKQEDINLCITTIRRYFTFCLLEHVKQNNDQLTRNGVSSNMIETSYVKDTSEDQVKVVEGTNVLVIYDREKLTIRKIHVKFDKKKLGCAVFLPGCRIYKNQEKVFFSGGKDITGDRKLFLAYNIKENKLIRLPDMCSSRSYHTSLFHESLKSLVVFGGENNCSCEMYDFYLNMWNTIPDFNIPRANPAVFIDKVGTFAYVISGIIGNITSNSYCDSIEFLDLVDMNQGWLKIEYKNKANVDLKKNETKIFPLTDNKLLIYGASESRSINKCFVVLDLKTFELTKVDNDDLENIKVKAKLNPDDGFISNLN